MKELTKQIRKEVKKVIDEVGGTANLLNKHITAINEKFLGKNYIYNDYTFEVLTTVNNQLNYFKYGKGL